MGHSGRLEGAIAAALQGGVGRFAFPSATTSLELVERLPSSVVARAYRGHELVHELRPTAPQEARPGTLSAKHGLGAFPAHVDGAHLKIPPHLVVLWCAFDDERRPTELYRWNDIAVMLDREAVEREVFVYRSGRDSRVDTIAGVERPFVRYDPGCMSPATRGAAGLLKQIEGLVMKRQPQVVDWEPGDGVVIDNWRMLHARGAPKKTAGTRRLFRMWLDPKVEA